MKKEEGQYLITPKTEIKVKKFIDSHLEKKGYEIPKKPKDKKQKKKKHKIPSLPLGPEPDK